MTKEERNTIENRIVDLELEISEHEYYLCDGRMSNPMKIKWRKRDLNKCKLKLAVLRLQLEG